MHGGNAEGGLAEVHWLGSVASPDVIEAAASRLEDLPAADCVRVFLAAHDGRYTAESFTPAGNRIRFCGHGALAAAWWVFEQPETNAASLQFSNADRSWLAQSSAAANADIRLTYDTPEVRDCTVPDWVRAALGAQPQAAAEAGGPADYLLLEFAGPEAVRTLQPENAAIGAATRRALIVTARAASEQGCVFRYFAPQYGVPEDAATGSAATQLAAYWKPRLGSDHFSASQLSLGGALMQLACHAGTVELAARVGYG